MRTFSLIWFGQTISIIGSSLTGFALYVWIFQQTGSVTRYTMLSVLAALPSILIGPFTGVLIDRWERRRVMILADVASAVVSCTVLALAATGNLRVWHIYPLVMASTLFANLQNPAFTAATTMLVPKQQFARAEGMRQFGEAAARIVAPLVAGYLLLRIRLQGVVLVDLSTFFVALIVSLIVSIPDPERTTEHGAVAGVSWWRQAYYGWSYLKLRPPLFRLLIYISLLNFFVGFAMVLFTPLMLSFATPAGLGTVLSTAGAGAVLGGLLLGVTGGPRRRIHGVLGFAFVAGPAIFLVGLSRSLPLIAAGAFLVAAGLPWINGSSQAIWQAKVAPEVQGRVFAFRRILAQATAPVAFLIAGPLADRICEPLMAPGGALAGSVGALIGVGKGRGIALIYLATGVITVLVGLGGLLWRGLHRIEDEVPDAVGEEKAQTAPAA
jgi:MFS family permease